MPPKDVSDHPADPMEAALAEFHQACTSGERPDLDAFCEKHPECGPELREKIEDMAFIMEGLPGPDRARQKVPETEERPERIAHFRILNQLGRGGQGTVYLAEDEKLHRRVALKVLPSHLSFSDEAVRKFHREAEAGGRQRHPGIVAIFAVGEHGGFHYIAQELVEDGTTLSDQLEEICRIGEQPPGYFRKAALLISEVADALNHAHESGVIHRDIKPSNVLLTGKGRPKVTDFGLARVEDALALSRTGDLAGTPCYMSPEQAMSGRVEIDKRTDIYSLGVTLYEMLTMRRPFEGQTSHEVLKKIILIDPLDPHKTNPKVPRDLSVICLKAMEKLPARRYQSMEEFGDDLRRFLQGEAILAKPAGLGVRFWKRVKRNPVVSAAVTVALAAVVVFALVVPWVIAQKEKENAKLLEAERNKAVTAKNDAEEQRGIAEARFEEIIRLADMKVLIDLQTDADKLWPAIPEKIPAMKSWLERAAELGERIDEHRGTLATLREKALQTGRDMEAHNDQVWKFDDPETQQWRQEALAELISGLEDLLEEEGGLLKSVKDRLDFAQTVMKRSIDDCQESWDEVCEWVAEDDRFGGFRLKPQLGLRPIGRDSVSGLWEFAHLPTGGIPERRSDGKLFLTEEMGLVLVLIPGGTFNMGAIPPSEENPEGSPNVDPATISAEGPVHEETIKPFFISKYEMTQGQWLRFTGNNPSRFKPGSMHQGKAVNLLHPVEKVSWEECVEVLIRLNLRLPTEAEWEYACRAGTTTVWWTGNEKESLMGAANLCDLSCEKNFEQPGWNFEEWDDGYVVHAPVGSFRPNVFGLHDVCGNVMEWCMDSYLVPDDSPHRGLRGGAWNELPYYSRSARRCHAAQNHFRYNKGLRPVCSIQ